MSDIPLPQTPETNLRKWIFVAIVCGILFVIVAFFVFMSGSGGSLVGGKGFNPKHKEIVIWTVGLDTKVFTDISQQFNASIKRSDIKLNVQNFSSFHDYIDILPRAMESDSPPDIVMIPNHGGYRFFDQYVTSLGSNSVDFTDFGNRFHTLFVDELVYSETIKGDGKDRIIQGLRGVPYGFEPMGIYYNKNLLEDIPRRWSTLADILKKPQEVTDTLSSEDGVILSEKSPVAETTENKSFINLGYGAATSNSPDILALLSLQAKISNLSGYATLNSVGSRSVFEKYIAFRDEPNNLSQFMPKFAETLTTTDLFVRGNIATMIGYPSTYRDILIAIDRARQSRTLDPDFLRNLRVATVPQEELDPKKQINFAKYMYFALVKNGAHRDKEKPSNDPVVRLMEFLLTEEAQTIFANDVDYALPTQKKILSEKKENTLHSDKNFIMTIADWYVPDQQFPLYDMGIPHLFREIVPKALDEPGATATSVTDFISAYMTCKVNQLTDSRQYSRSCFCLNSLPKNGNNYWPLCSQE